MTRQAIHIIGAGLAGSEAAWQIAEAGIPAIIHEMKPQKFSAAHKNPNCAELVCSNSLRSDDFEHNAVGLLHEEMRRCGSLIMACADATKVPAGGALAVDRDGFAAMVTEKLNGHPLIRFETGELTELPPETWGESIIATGPLTSEKLADAILTEVDRQSLSFYDAIAPVVYKESIDFSKAWYQSRYDKGDKLDYINCPLSKEQYYQFVDALLKAEKAEFHDWEEVHYFDGCLPIEVMAERGIETLVFGPMKPCSRHRKLLLFPCLLSLGLQLQDLCFFRRKLLLVAFCSLGLRQFQGSLLLSLQRCLLTGQFLFKLSIPHLLCNGRVAFFINLKWFPTIGAYQFLFHILKPFLIPAVSGSSARRPAHWYLPEIWLLP